MTAAPNTNSQDFLTRAQKVAEEAAALAADAGHIVADAANTHADYFFMSGLTVFALSCFVGYYVVWRVTPALHSPLMGITNAISSVIIVGALIAAGPSDFSMSKLMGFFAVILASINIFGGFIVTRRMLSMFKKKPTPAPVAKDAA
ncbi:MAG: NAD synthetase [Micavibrio aeruginosavorus]|uniref:proton-translocating NAD(P)(+) transhydrogenase n=1 Tax=Micavibrio aeruginosavorus TaxID=349221 RepID=A0A2W5N5H7_9BACT|nr:MAG: NAD synthetase [Micavibrio aeruginosavorus]